MSLMAFPRGLLSMMLILAMLGTVRAWYTGELSEDAPDWNYDSNGSDWDFESCNVSTNTQSPITVGSGGTVLDWSSTDDVSILTGWQTGSFTSADQGASNYIYRVNATDGNLGVFYATQPIFNSVQIAWVVEQIRFRYPAEHSINGETFDMEM